MKEYDVIYSFAKINLGLWIIDKREDGFHNIVTVFHKIGLHDIIKICPSDNFQILTIGAEIESEKNIILKAKQILEKKFLLKLNYRVEIEKKIPIGSGLGGASSNAAYFIKYVNEKEKLGLETKELIAIGNEIGADVPFFLIKENAAIGTKKGEVLEPFHSGFKFPLILGFPKVQVLTKVAYEKFDINGTFTSFSEAYRKACKIVEALQNNDLNELPPLENSFLPVLKPEFPEIIDLMEIISELGAKQVSLSGSGSAVYGIFDRIPLLENFGELLVPSSFLQVD